jgi:predicted DNA-binding ribbon-helix-helix protein
MKSSVAKRSVVIAGHRTSVSLEDAFWNCLREIAKARRETVQRLVGSINAHRQEGNLSAALRVFVLGFYRDQVEKTQGRVKAFPGSSNIPLKSIADGRRQWMQSRLVVGSRAGRPAD